jgi:hypothetical protein
VSPEAHNVFIGIIGALAIVNTGLAAWMVHKYHDHRAPFYPGTPSNEWRNRLFFLLFTSVWTSLFAVLHWLFNRYIGTAWAVIVSFCVPLGYSSHFPRPGSSGSLVRAANSLGGWK